MLKGKLCHGAEKAKKQHHGLLTIQYRVSFYNSFRENVTEKVGMQCNNFESLPVYVC